MTEQMEQMRELFDKLEERFSKKLDKVEDKIDKLGDASVANTVQLANNTASLNEHMRRTEILEEEVRTSRSQMRDMEIRQDDVEKSVSFITNIPKYIYILIKWSAAISTSSGAIYAIIKLISTIKL